MVAAMGATFGLQKGGKFLVPKSVGRFSKNTKKWGPVLGPKMGPILVHTERTRIDGNMYNLPLYIVAQGRSGSYPVSG